MSSIPEIVKVKAYYYVFNVFVPRHLALEQYITQYRHGKVHRTLDRNLSLLDPQYDVRSTSRIAIMDDLPAESLRDRSQNTGSLRTEYRRRSIPWTVTRCPRGVASGIRALTREFRSKSTDNQGLIF